MRDPIWNEAVRRGQAKAYEKDLQTKLEIAVESLEYIKDLQKRTKDEGHLTLAITAAEEALSNIIDTE